MIRATFVAVILAATSAAPAAVIYTYTAAPTTLATPAGSVGFDVFLTETLTAGSASLVEADGGLDSAAFRIERAAGDGAILSDLTFNPAFDSGVNARSVADTAASLTESTDLGSPGVMLNDGRVYLGTAWFTGSGEATFSLELYDDFGGNVLTRMGRSLDTDPGDDGFVPLAGGAIFNVVVPEPTVAAIVFAGVTLGLGRRNAATG